MKCEIISEIGINHNGNLGIAKELILQSKNAGADVAKFQLYDPEKLLDERQFSKDDWDAIVNSKLDFSEVRELKNLCDQINIEFLASAFDEERLTWLEDLNVKRHKIASRSLYNKKYVKAVIETKKPLIASFGYYDPNKENYIDTMNRLDWNNYPESISLLYCISDYPTRLEDLNFNFMMIGGSHLYDGFSDHTIGITASCVAMTLGAKIIEKHFTYDKNAIGPDHKCSMDFKELKALCKFRDDLRQINF